MSPTIRALLETSLSSYRHEQLLENADQMCILQQHGSVDDNVPAFHSRLMSNLIQQTGAASTYIELQGKNHWFDGVMTTPALAEFYERQLQGLQPSVHPPGAFTLVVANPADSGPKFGLRILHLRRQGQLGRLDASFSSSSCYIRTSNVLIVRLARIFPQTHDIVIDDQKLEIRLPVQEEHLDFLLTSNGTWKVRFQNDDSSLHQC